MRAMRAGSKPSRSTAELAILALALNALWPLIASARPAGTESRVEVCTAQGVSRVAVDPGSAPDDAGAGHLQQHCPLCVFGADKAAAGPSAPLHKVAAAAAGRAPADRQPVAAGADSRSPAQPRAPPSVS
jgi:hypothetical protein